MAKNSRNLNIIVLLLALADPLYLIFSSGSRLKNLIIDLLDTTRLKDKRLRFDNCPVDITPIADGVTRVLVTLASEKINES